jgi:hypothetical protein
MQDGAHLWPSTHPTGPVILFSANGNYYAVMSGSYTGGSFQVYKTFDSIIVNAGQTSCRIIGSLLWQTGGSNMPSAANLPSWFPQTPIWVAQMDGLVGEFEIDWYSGANSYSLSYLLGPDCQKTVQGCPEGPFFMQLNDTTGNLEIHLGHTPADNGGTWRTYPIPPTPPPGSQTITTSGGDAWTIQVSQFLVAFFGS